MNTGSSGAGAGLCSWVPAFAGTTVRTLRTYTYVKKVAAASGLLLLLAPTMAGCGHAPPRLMVGDTEAAQVSYSGDDLPAATEVANRHCARFERVAFYENSAEDIAYFACVRRHR